MRTIWKYPLRIADEQVVSLPKGARILSVMAQGDRDEAFHLWAMVDPSAEAEPRIIVIVGTGHPLDESRGELVHLITFKQFGGALVWHVFERVSAFA